MHRGQNIAAHATLKLNPMFKCAQVMRSAPTANRLAQSYLLWLSARMATAVPLYQLSVHSNHELAAAKISRDEGIHHRGEFWATPASHPSRCPPLDTLFSADAIHMIARSRTDEPRAQIATLNEIRHRGECLSTGPLTLWWRGTTELADNRAFGNRKADAS
jgi:hypothetical protein